MTHSSSLALLGVLLLVTACDSLDTSPTPGKVSEGARCAPLEGKRFVSVDMQSDCGPVPAGTHVDCYWSVTFAAKDDATSSFSFLHSDVGDGGTVTCVGGIVMQTDGANTGTYDPNTDRLEWNGIVYAAQ